MAPFTDEGGIRSTGRSLSPRLRAALRMPWGLPALVLIPLLSLSLLVYLDVKQNHLQELSDRLENLALVQEDWFDTFLTGRERQLHIIGRAGPFTRELRSLALSEPIPRAEIAGVLAELLRSDSLLVSARLLDTAGREIAFAGAGRPEPGPVLLRARGDREEHFVGVDSVDVAPGIVEVWRTPLAPGNEVTLELRYTGEELLSVVTDSAGLGPTGEVLVGAVDAEGEVRFLGPVRFGGVAPLARLRGTGDRLPIEEAIAGRHAVLDSYVDYRGEPVFAAIRHLEATGWGLVVKMDRAQAMQPVTRLGTTLLGGLAVIGGVMTLLGAQLGQRLREEEEELRQANLRLRRTLRASPFPAMVHADDGAVLLVSDSWLERTGYSRDELRTVDAWTRRAYGSAAAEVQRFIDDLYEQDRVHDGVFTVRTAEGDELLWDFSSMTLGPLPDGRRTVLSMAVDMTGSLHLTERLREARDRLSATLDAMPIPFWRIDSEGRVRQLNPAAEEVFGWSEEELIGEPLPVVPDDRRDEYRRYLDRVLAGERLLGVETVRRRRDGKELPVLLHAAGVRAPDGSVDGAVAIYEDLTEEHRREQELLRLNRALSFVSASNAALVRKPLDSDLLEEICRVAIEVGGYSHIWIAHREEESKSYSILQASRGKEIDLRSLVGLAEEIDAAATAGVALVTRGILGGDSAWERRLAKAGYATLVAHPFPPDSSIDGFVALAHEDPKSLDRPEVQVLSELAADLSYGLWVSSLRQELELVTEAVRNLTLGVGIVDAEEPDYPLVYANPGLATLLGREFGDLEGVPIEVLRSETTDGEVWDEIDRALRGGTDIQVTFRSARHGTDDFWNRFTLQPVHDPDGHVSHFVAIVEDVTEQRSIGRELEHRARLAAVGELAGGVAHDFRNILTASHGLLKLSLGDDHLDEAARENLAELERLVNRGKSITERLLVLSRRGGRDPEPLDLRGALEEAASLAEHTLRDDILVELELPQDPIGILVDPDQFATTVLNLSRNAAQAMDEGGTLTFEVTGPVEVDEPEWWPANWPSGRPLSGRPSEGDQSPWVRVTVRDTGCGMGPDTLAHAFDPYFTTKPAGEGTGLGLPTVYAAVEQMGGRVWIESEVGVGTEVHLLLPVLRSFARGCVDEPAPVETDGVRGRTGTVLLAEDDPSVLRVFEKALLRVGHTVIAGRDGEEALGAFLENPERVDMVVTDGFMPRMSGAELAQAVWAERPGLPVVVTSGFGAEDIRKEFPEDPAGPLIFRPKPLSIEDLEEVVREQLSRSGDDS